MDLPQFFKKHYDIINNNLSWLAKQDRAFYDLEEIAALLETISSENSELKLIVRFFSNPLLVTRTKQLIEKYLTFLVKAHEDMAVLIRCERPMTEKEYWNAEQKAIDSFTRARNQLDELKRIIEEYGSAVH